VLKAGDHLLVCDNAYRPTRIFCDGLLARYGIETTYFDPLIAPVAAIVQAQHKAILVRGAGSQSSRWIRRLCHPRGYRNNWRRHRVVRDEPRRSIHFEDANRAPRPVSPCVGLEQWPTPAPISGSEIGRLDAVACEQSVAEISCPGDKPLSQTRR